MKFVCSSKSFTEAFNNVALAVDSRSGIPTLQGIRLCCGSNEVTLTGYDLELAITKRLEALTEGEGDALLVYRVFHSFFEGYTPIDDRLHVEVNNKTEISMETKDRRKWLKDVGLCHYEYPEIPEVITEKRIVISGRTLRYIISWITKTTFDKSDTVPMISGALFELSDGKLHITAVDGSYVIKGHESVKEDVNFSFAVSRKTMIAMNKILSDTDVLEYAEIAVGSDYMSLTVDGYTLISLLSNAEDFEKRIKALGYDE